MLLRPFALVFLLVLAPLARAQDSLTLDDALLELRAAAESAAGLQRATAEAKVIASRAERRAVSLEGVIAALERMHAAAEEDVAQAATIVRISERALADVQARIAAAGKVIAVLQAAGGHKPDPGPDPGPDPDPDPGPDPDPDPDPPVTGYPDDSVWDELPEWVRDRHAAMIGHDVLAMPAQEFHVDASTPRDELRAMAAGRDVGRVPVFIFEDQIREGFGISDSWNRDVTLSTLSSGAAFFVAENEPTRVVVAASRGLEGDHPIAQNTPKVVFDPRGVRRGGDCVGIHSNDHRCDIYFAGVGIAALGRAGLFTHPNAGQRVTLLSSHLYASREHIAANESMKWGAHLIDTTFASQDLSVDLTGIQEHTVYEHGHGGGFPGLHSRLLNLGCGGQVYQGTERQYEVDPSTPDILVFDDCVMTGFARAPSRAGSAITLAGNSRPCVIKDSLVFDDDPDDTVSPNPQHAGKNYGLLAVWVPNDPTESYRHLPDRDGRANRAVIISDSVLATRNPGREAINVTEATHFEMRGSAFAVAETAPRGVVEADRSDVEAALAPGSVPVAGPRLRALIGERLDAYRVGDIGITDGHRPHREFTTRIRDRASDVADATGLAELHAMISAYQRRVVEAGVQ